MMRRRVSEHNELSWVSRLWAKAGMHCITRAPLQVCFHTPRASPEPAQPRWPPAHDSEYPGRHRARMNTPAPSMNKAAAIELESRLSLRRSQAAAIIAYRARNGKFKSIEYVKNGPQGGCGEDRSQRRRHCILIPAAFIDA